MTNIAQILTINEKIIDGALGTRTWGGWMVGSDKTTEQLQNPSDAEILHQQTI